MSPNTNAPFNRNAPRAESWVLRVGDAAAGPAGVFIALGRSAIERELADIGCGVYREKKR
jgi:hypothetical protein